MIDQQEKIETDRRGMIVRIVARENLIEGKGREPSHTNVPVGLEAAHDLPFPQGNFVSNKLFQLADDLLVTLGYNLILQITQV